MQTEKNSTKESHVSYCVAIGYMSKTFFIDKKSGIYSTQKR